MVISKASGSRLVPWHDGIFWQDILVVEASEGSQWGLMLNNSQVRSWMREESDDKEY